MASLKHLSPLAALFLLSSSLVLRLGTAGLCYGQNDCYALQIPPCGNVANCVCVPVALIVGQCMLRSSLSLPAVAKKIEAHPNLCESDAECVNKGSGNFCARFPNPHVHHGWCIDSAAALSPFFSLNTTAA